MSIRILLTVALVILVTATAVHAQDVDRVETNAGKLYEGTIVSDDGETVEFRTRAGMTLTLPYDSLTLKTRYRLRRDRTPDDADAQADLADWCVDQTLYEDAERHYRAALAADATKSDEINARIARARTKAANELLERAKSMQASNLKDDARMVLTTIVKELPLEPAAKEAAALLAGDNEDRKQSAFARRAELSRGAPAGELPPEGEREVRASGEPFSEAAYQTFGQVIEHYRSMLDNTHEGLVDGNQSGAIKSFEKALKDGDKARKEVEEIRPRGAGDEEIAEALALVDGKLEEAIVECRIHLADAYMLRESYNQAAEAVNKGLAEYPQNPRLRSAKDRLTMAASSDDDDVRIFRRGGFGGGFGRR